ncbi:hypothetical protein JCM3765_006656 [Sporobolomyces pararoseus]
MNYQQAQTPPPVSHHAPNGLPSPFLSSSFAAPPTPLQPSDLYGARLKVTLNHVKNEIGAMREDLEGVMQVRDELDSLRKEIRLVRELVDTQGETLEKRVIDAVSSLLESKLTPLFDSLLKSSNSLSSSFKVYDSSSISRARAQNERIEEVERSNKRKLEEVERQLASERTNIRRDSFDFMTRMEEKLRLMLKEEANQLSKAMLDQAHLELAKKLGGYTEMQASVERKVESLATSIEPVLQLKRPSNDRACTASFERLQLGDTTTRPFEGPAARVPSVQPAPAMEKMIVSNEVSTPPPAKSSPELPLVASPPSPTRRRSHRVSQSKSLERSQNVNSQQASPLGASKRPSPRTPAPPSRVEVSIGRAAPSSEAASTGGGKSGKGSRIRGRRFIQQDLSQNQESGRVGTVGSAAKEEVGGGDAEGEEPDTIE